MTANVKMYTSAWCPFCIQAKRLLDSKGVAYTEIPVDGQPKTRAQMMQESGRYTVPQIWINNMHVGGCDDLFALERDDKLDTLLT
ncbi:MAG: glutaredoxin 3 [Reinekea sp.]|jgi:glutaredoxin 3